jgi:hypothetical protein
VSRPSSSPFTAIRSAWKVFVAGWIRTGPRRGTAAATELGQLGRRCAGLLLAAAARWRARSGPRSSPRRTRAEGAAARPRPPPRGARRRCGHASGRSACPAGPRTEKSEAALGGQHLDGGEPRSARIRPRARAQLAQNRVDGGSPSAPRRSARRIPRGARSRDGSRPGRGPGR